MNRVTGRVIEIAVKSIVFPVQAMKAYAGSRGIPPLILNLGTSIPRRFLSFLPPLERTLLSIEYGVVWGTVV
jgi:hypothetical protein